MIYVFLSTLYLISQAFAAGARPSTCSGVFDTKHHFIEESSTARASAPTSEVISYVGELFSRGDIRLEELKRLSDSLSRGEIQNPYLTSIITTDSAKSIVASTLIDLLKQPGVNFEKITSRLSVIIAQARAESVERDEVSGEIRIATHPMVFFPIEPGGYTPPVNARADKTDVRINYLFEAMSTLVTQYHWVDLMGSNPSLVPANNPLQLYKHRNATLVPDHPVTNLTWWSAIVFANELSRKHNLKPAYDLSGFQFTDSSLGNASTVYFANDPSHWPHILEIAARGDLMIPAHFEKANWINNILSAEGYRLITIAEYEYLLTLSEICQFYHDHDQNKLHICRYAWTIYNDRGGIEAVAGLDPSDIFGNSFFDIIGNVYIWTQDSRGKFSGGLNPLFISPIESARSVKSVTSTSIVSPGFKNMPMHITDATDDKLANGKDDYVGLRLVRTIHFPKENGIE